MVHFEGMAFIGKLIISYALPEYIKFRLLRTLIVLEIAWFATIAQIYDVIKTVTDHELEYSRTLVTPSKDLFSDSEVKPWAHQSSHTTIAGP